MLGEPTAVCTCTRVGVTEDRLGELGTEGAFALWTGNKWRLLYFCQWDTAAAVAAAAAVVAAAADGVNPTRWSGYPTIKARCRGATPQCAVAPFLILAFQLPVECTFA